MTDSKSDPMRNMLLKLICAAPDPWSFASTLPHYQVAWDEARKMLRDTCPDHIVDGGGTCENCHADTDGDEVTTEAPATADSDDEESGREFIATYRITATKTIHADDEDDARSKAWDEVPYPDVDGGDCDSADCDEVIIEEA